jgi:tRNA1(Val) A37 N6-methylase TrmN6
MAKTKQKKKLHYKTTKHATKKMRVEEEQAMYYTDTALSHSLIPIDSIICGDALHILQNIPDRTIDLIVPSPPYADKRTNSYGGIR